MGKRLLLPLRGCGAEEPGEGRGRWGKGRQVPDRRLLSFLTGLTSCWEEDSVDLWQRRKLGFRRFKEISKVLAADRPPYKARAQPSPS